MTPIHLRVRYGGLEHTVALSAEPLSIGRAPSNGLRLAEPSVSWHHATLWVSDGRLHVQDLNSTNGVSIDGVRVQGTAAVPEGAVVQLGDRVTLTPLQAAAGPAPRLLVGDLKHGQRIPLQPGVNELAPLGIGPDARLWLGPGGELHAQISGAMTPVRLGEPLALGGGRIRVVEADRPETVGQRDEPWPYRLTVRLTGPAGPEAELVDRVGGTRHVVTAENRAALMYLLARQVRDDLAAGRPEADVGWCADDDLAMSPESQDTPTARNRAPASSVARGHLRLPADGGRDGPPRSRRPRGERPACCWRAS